MKLILLKINGFKNLQDFEIDFTKSEGISVLVGNNGSGKSNVLEAISAIFYGLYDETNERRCAFSYELKYIIDGKEIFIKQIYSKNKKDVIGKVSEEILSKITDGETELRFVGCYIDGEYIGGNLNKLYLPKEFDGNYLPSNIIALYSGEETRLYENYYKYDLLYEFKKQAKGEKFLRNMIFFDKKFWNIAIIMLFLKVVNFDENDEVYKNLEDILGKNILIEKFELFFNEKNIKKIKKGSILDQITIEGINFFKTINGKSIIELNSLKYNDDFLDFGKFYKYLSLFYLGKDDLNFIEDINITFNNGINSKHLSEGQKKQILIYFVTEVLADKNSIILLDEPDSYVHVGNKEKIKNFLENFIKSYNGEGQVILTTHSPTLMHDFGENHLYYLENGKVAGEEKRKILSKITDGKMSLGEMEVILNSGKKYLLVTEGKTDKKHLELAIEKLGIKDDFDIFPSDGSDKVKQFLIGLPSELLGDKIVIGIFDHDDAGLNALKRIGDEIEKNKVYKVKNKENIYGISLPCFDENYSKLKTKTIEFMYPANFVKEKGSIEKLNLRELNNKLSEKEQLNITDYEKLEELYYFRFCDSNKNNFIDECYKLDKKNFKEFKVLFDLILTING